MSDPIDPRTAAITDRLSAVERIIAVTGSKGGIGKSVVATVVALALADQGHRVGLFDLDFTSPTDHVVLGSTAGFPSETFGIDPHDVHGIGVMSVAFLSGAAPAPLRGVDTTNALVELLAITRWGSRSVLVLDMPPGLGDASLDVMRYIPRAEFLLVANGSRMVIDSVRRAARLLTETNAPVIGLVENLRRDTNPAVQRLAEESGIPLLGSIPFDRGLETALGDVAALRETQVYAALQPLAARIIEPAQ